MSTGGRPGGDTVLVAALAAGATYGVAGKTAGVSERTVRRRLAEPAFRQQVDDARAEILGQTVARLTAASTDAVETLRGLLASEMDFARLGAARAILEIGLKLREHGDLAARVAALEAALANREGSTA